MVQFMTFWKRENYRDQNQIPGFQGLVTGRGGDYKVAHRNLE